jgi:glycerophosphoryl diester phosphodiesterase
VLAATVVAALGLAAPSARAAPGARAAPSARAAPGAHARAGACPVLLAHQGYTGRPGGRGPVPADSVPAISDAVRHGARIVELDVRWSADNVPVVIHNATVSATTRRHGRVAHYRAAKLVRMRLRSAGGLTRDRLPTLQRALRKVAAVAATAVVEIKTRQVTPAEAVSFTAAVAAAGARQLVSVHSFYQAPLAALRYPATLLTETPVSGPRGAARVRGDVGVDLRGSIVTRRLVQRLHAAHLRAGAWTSDGSGVVDGPRSWSRLAADGVDRIITGDTPGYRAWCASVSGRGGIGDPGQEQRLPGGGVPHQQQVRPVERHRPPGHVR